MKLYDLIKEIYFCLDDGDRQLLDGYNLTVPRFYLLKHIAENPGISLTQLSVLMLSDKSNITRLIKAVESDNLVYRERHATDRRTWSLYLTDEGENTLSDAIRAHNSFVKARFDNLDNEAEELFDELQKVKRVLETQLVYSDL